jgi:hypothetical protein
MTFFILPPEARRDFGVRTGYLIHVPDCLAAAESEFRLEQPLVTIGNARVDNGYRIMSFVQTLFQQVECLGHGQLGFDGLTSLAAISDPLIPGFSI